MSVPQSTTRFRPPIGWYGSAFPVPTRSMLMQLIQGGFTRTEAARMLELPERGLTTLLDQPRKRTDRSA